MAANVETLGTLERRVSMSLPVSEIDKQVDERLKKLARNVRMPGFRPGKVPMKLVTQTYGPQVRTEVLGESVQKTFSDVVKEAKLRVAGYPRIERKGDPSDDKSLEFSATFEIYPEVKVGDLSTRTVERPRADVGDAEVDKTIEILRKQRTTFADAARPAQDEDRVVADFAGTIDGQPFEGGAGADFAFILGQGRMLPEFESAARGMSAGESKTFALKFPADYHGRDVAGKDASFSITLKKVQQPQLPALDAEFAKSLGVADGDLAKMRSEVRANVEREVKKRVDARVKQQTLDALLAATPLEIPKSLIEMESHELAQRAAADLQARGMKIDKLPIEPAAFGDTARRRVALGLVIAELQHAENLKPKPAEVRALVEQEAQSYESPAEVVKWFYMQPQRLSEMESAALEANVVNWVLSKAKVVDKDIPFDELMK